VFKQMQHMCSVGGRRIVNTTQLIRKKGVYSNMYKTTCFGQQWPSSLPTSYTHNGDDTP